MISTAERVREQQYAEYQRYLEYVQRERYELATDLAERLGYPIIHIIPNPIVDGHVRGKYDLVPDRPFIEQTVESLQDAKRDYAGGPNAFEITRRQLEHEEALRVDQLRHGEALIKISPIPDAVINGTATIDAYRPDLKRGFVRIHYRVGEVVNCLLFSFDGADPDAMRAMGTVLGIDTVGKSSEQVLAIESTKAFADGLDMEMQAVQAIEEYDRVMSSKLGRKVYQGSEYVGKDDALTIVMAQGVLLDECMDALNDLKKFLSGDDLAIEKERVMCRYAAAMDESYRQGRLVSAHDSSVDTAMSERSYEGYCPTSIAQSPTQTKETFVSKVCPLCGAKNVLTTREGAIISGGCGCKVDVCRPGVQLGRPKPSPVQTERIGGSRTSPLIRPPRLTEVDRLLEMAKKIALTGPVIYSTVGVGGVDHTVVDASGQRYRYVIGGLVAID